MSRYTVRIRFHMDSDDAAEVEEFAEQVAAPAEKHEDVTEVWTDWVQQGVPSGRPPTDRLHAERWLTHYLARQNKPAAPADVFDAAGRAGISRRTLRRAAESIRVVKTPPTGGKTRWTLPRGEDDG